MIVRQETPSHWTAAKPMELRMEMIVRSVSFLFLLSRIVSTESPGKIGEKVKEAVSGAGSGGAGRSASIAGIIPRNTHTELVEV